MHRMKLPATALASIVLASGCGGTGGITVPRPTGLAPAAPTDAASWARTTIPTESREIRFRWQFRDDQGAAGGRGRVRWAMPDSARLDVTGPLGSGRAAAFVNGDTAAWAEPKEDVKRLIPNYPLFWALLGVVRGPEPGAAVRRYSDDRVTMWRYARGPDTTDYVRVSGSPGKLFLEVREAGKPIGTVETRLDAAGAPVSARLVVPSVPARLDVSFTSNVKATSFASDAWTPPRP